MSRIKLFCIPALLAILVLTGTACAQSAGSKEKNQQTAEEFVKLESTFRFDGMPETLEVTSTTSVSNGWEYTIEFDSQHAGYGNRSGQILAQVITHHRAKVTVQDGQVTKAIMDDIWDMIEQKTIGELEIKQAPIHEVDVNFMESFPIQVGVHIKGGLSDGCTTFHDAVVYIQGNVINIQVTTQRPRDVFCTAIYTYFEKNINLGSDFTAGTTYTVKVNNYTTTFDMPR